jgi:hypothetical protein
MAFQLVELGGGVGYFKGGLYGFAGSGKTHTGIDFLLGLREYLGLKGRVGMFDTETGSEYVDPMVLKRTGQHIIGAKSRSLQDAIDFLLECEKQGVAVAMVDSTTHIWEEVQKSYLRQINESRKRRNLPEKSNIEWQDRGPLNDIWQKFTDTYINSKLHIIICGRAANLWEMEVNKETNKKELNKVGTKMKTQSDMAYEPSFLAEMEREQLYDDKGNQRIVRTITVLKDRFRILDGKQCQNPTFDFIKPHAEMLKPGVQNAVDTSRETPLNVNEEGNVEWNSERRNRAIFCEEIQGLLTSVWPGQGAEEKRAKVEILHRLFQTRSWEAIQIMEATKLKAGFDKMHEEIKKYTADEAAKQKAEADSKAAEEEIKKNAKKNRSSDVIQGLETALTKKEGK